MEYEDFLRALARSPKSEQEPTDLAAGDTVGHYRILRRLGRGGMAVVYLARDVTLGRMVALKLLTEATAKKTEILAEAKVTALFNHPNIVTIYAAGEFRDQSYLALEYVDGETLRSRLQTGPILAAAAARIARAIASALAVAHKRGLIHRDLKPGNVMIDRDGRVRVLDFGISRLLAPDNPADEGQTSSETGGPISNQPRGWKEDLETQSLSSAEHGSWFSTEGESTRLTQAGDARHFGGTPAYMAPEQWQNQPVTPAADVWALGVIVYEMIAGQHPYLARTRTREDLRQWVCHGDAPPFFPTTAIPTTVATWIAGCLQRDPLARPSAGEVLKGLDSFLDPHARISHDVSPFRGLLSFEEEHRHLFFGREREVEAFVERLRTTPILPIVGPSGGGKSSFVKAGVIPRLREQRPVLMLHMRPGRDPFFAAAEALASHDTGRTPITTDTSGQGPRTLQRLNEPSHVAHQLRDVPSLLGLLLHRLAEDTGAFVVFFVDQLEELCAIDDSPAPAVQSSDSQSGESNPTDRTLYRFMEALSLSASVPEIPVRVVVTFREELWTRLVVSPSAQRAFSNVVTIRQPNPDTLRTIMRLLVRVVGYDYEDPSLVKNMVREVHTERASLALLQFAGARLWEGRDLDNKLLTTEVYNAMGGVVGALIQHADSVVAGFSPNERELCRMAFLRLVTPDRTRRNASPEALLEMAGDQAATMSNVLTRLVDMRLLLAEGRDDTNRTVELVHEALIEKWPTLTNWLDDSKEESRFLARLTNAAKEWARSGRQEGYLWRGVAADEAALFGKQHLDIEHPTAAVSRDEREYLDAVVALAASMQRVRRRLFFGAFATVLAFALVLGALLFKAQRGEARAREGQQFAKDVLTIAYAEKHQSNPTTAFNLLREVTSPDPPPAWAQFAHEALGQPLTRAVLRQPTPVRATASSRDGTLLASGGADGTVRLWRREALHQEPVVFEGHDGDVLALAFAPDGKTLASGGADATLRLWSTATSLANRRHAPHGDTGRAPRALRSTFTAHTQPIRALAFDPSGKILASASDDATVRLWTPALSAEPQTLTAHTQPVHALAFATDGTRLVSGGEGEEITIWHLPPTPNNTIPQSPRPKLTHTLRGHRGPLLAVAFDPAGTAVIASDTTHVHRWDLTLKAPKNQLHFPWGDKKPTHVAFQNTPSHGALRIVAAFADRTVRTYHGRPGDTPAELKGHDQAVTSATFVGSAPLAFSGDNAGILHLSDAVLGHDADALCGHAGPVYSVATAPVGHQVVSAGDDGTVRWWNLERPRATSRIVGYHDGPVYDVAFSPDGTQIATAGDDGTVHIASLVYTEAQVTVLRGHIAWVEAVVWSPDGKRLASAGEDRTVRLWPIQDNAAPTVLKGHTDTVRDVAFSPDGKRLASVSADGTARIWTVDELDQEPVVLRHTSGLWAVRFASERELLTAGADGVVRRWHTDAPDARPTMLTRHGSRIYDLALSPDGTLLASASLDHTVRLISLKQDPEDLAPIILRGHTRGVLGVTFTGSGDALRVLSSGADGTLRHWTRIARPTPQDPALWSATRVCLTPEFRQETLSESAEEAMAGHAECMRRGAHPPRARPPACGDAPGFSVERHRPAAREAGAVTSFAGPAGITWVNFPPGWFRMGATNGAGSAQPLHWARISAFALAQTETTVRQYLDCVAAGACRAIPDAPRVNTRLPQDRAYHPVQVVTWPDARAFCTWVGGRLPTESEWEYAARGAGQPMPHPWGRAEPNCDLVIHHQTGDEKPSCGRGYVTWPVCSRPRGHSAQGLCDLAGNVWEWVADFYDPTYYLNSPLRAPPGPPPTPLRALRGGSWGNVAKVIGASKRDSHAPGYGSSVVGFRCARSAVL